MGVSQLMNIDKDIIKKAYAFSETLIRLISNKDLERLNREFNIRPDIFEEIEEVLESVDASSAQLFVNLSHFDVYEYNEGGYGIDARVLTDDGKDTHLTLITSLNERGESPDFKYIGVQ